MTRGLLRQRVQVLTPTRTPNGAGGRTVTYATAGYVPGRIVATAGQGGASGEGLPGDRVESQEMIDAYLDAQLVAVTSNTRIAYDGATYEVLGVDRQGTLVRLRCRKVL